MKHTYVPRAALSPVRHAASIPRLTGCVHTTRLLTDWASCRSTVGVASVLASSTSTTSPRSRRRANMAFRRSTSSWTLLPSLKHGATTLSSTSRDMGRLSLRVPVGMLPDGRERARQPGAEVGRRRPAELGPYPLDPGDAGGAGGHVRGGEHRLAGEARDVPHERDDVADRTSLAAPDVVGAAITCRGEGPDRRRDYVVHEHVVQHLRAVTVDQRRRAGEHAEEVLDDHGRIAVLR